MSLVKHVLWILASVVGFVALFYWYDNRIDSEDIIRLANQKTAEYGIAKKDYAVVVDFSRSLFSRRLYLVNLQEGRIELRSRVSHAFLSGRLYAHDLSNVSGSKKSCGGAFLTAEPYQGKYGYSMVIQGLDKGKNDRAKARHIVFHPMKWNFPWSQGCFATPVRENQYIIQKMARGRLVHVISGEKS